MYKTYINLAMLILRRSVSGRVDAKDHLELALRYLEEGKSLVDEDPVQASEKLYKAAEEVVKSLTSHFGLSDIIKRVGERGRWTATELEKAVEAITEKVGEWFRYSWDAAWVLHVWGFHEAKLDSKAVKLRLPSIERMTLEARRTIGKE
jgi:hypothetical protein